MKNLKFIDYIELILSAVNPTLQIEVELFYSRGPAPPPPPITFTQGYISALCTNVLHTGLTTCDVHCDIGAGKLLINTVSAYKCHNVYNV